MIRRTLAGTGTLALAATLIVVFTASGHSNAAAATTGVVNAPASAASGPLGFSHAVVVDEQRPGFEPDVKAAPDGTIYSSVPNGFSTTASYVWDSLDHGNSYQSVPGTLALGKPATCIGGGDSDLYVDPGNALYFSDLQGLTNISNSVSTDKGATWSTNCDGAGPNTPDDRMWFAGSGSLAKSNLKLYQDFDVVGGSLSNQGGNALVEMISTDGTTFQPVVNPNPPTDCFGVAVDDCVTGNEGISGNQVVDPATGNVYIAHTTIEGSAGTPGVRVAEGKITPGTTPSPASATWSESPNLDAALCADPTCVDKNGNPEEIAGENFASIAQDSAGYLYITFTAGPIDHASSNDANFGALTAPEQIYVVHSLEPATTDPSKVTWSAPQKITGSGASAGTNTFPWITAGSGGRVDVAWYHTNEISEKGTCASGSGTCTLYGASSLSNAEWTVQLGQSLNAHDASPIWSTSNVSESPVKHGSICTNGIGCATGGDRSLGDFLQVGIDKQGAALVSYVFDTSADTSAGEDAGPEVISRQISGASLIASQGSATQGSGPGTPAGSVSDPIGDADYSAGGTRTMDSTGNLDLTGASLANGPNHTLVARIDVKTLSTLTPASGLGGSDASWLIRWTVVDPGTTGNGHIYYAGMDNNAGLGGSGTPSFFAGDTAGIPPANPEEHTKYFAYPQTHVLSSSQASYDKHTGVITLNIPLADVGNPPLGKVLYSATAFSATSLSPQSSDTLFNLIDSTPPFDFVISAPGTNITPPPYSPSGKTSTRCQAATGRLHGQTVGRLKLGMTRTRARREITHYSTRGRRHEDFFCLRPVGIRAGYGYAKLVRVLPRAQRRRLLGRIVFISTADRRYRLHGVRAGTSVRTARRRLHLNRAMRIGRNVWFLARHGSSRGVLKTRHGRVLEVGIANRHFTSNRARERRLLRALG